MTTAKCVRLLQALLVLTALGLLLAGCQQAVEPEVQEMATVTATSEAIATNG
ncbi:MAG TPA: hypothetical protein VK879_12535 [Candidatus Sulfomarinibacteraceae bacterium]|nr:hypothetical protein [Candidatus Sulfomarinibacteraceae bacterium]